MNEEQNATCIREDCSRVAPDPGHSYLDGHCCFACRDGFGWHAKVCDDAAKDAEVRCTDHWHCDPALAAHNCDAPERAFPCPCCGAEVRS